MLTLVGASNAVNLADGLDGLAGGCLLLTTGAMAALVYASGHSGWAEYLGVAHVPHAAEVVVLAGGVLGAILGFLWFNCYPASVFMGDTGSLPLGGLLGYFAIVCRQELLLAVVGGVFVVEALSVLAQVGSCKLLGRRVLLCAPLHHHFQFLGWPENKIVVRFWIASALAAIAGLGIVKLDAQLAGQSAVARSNRANRRIGHADSLWVLSLAAAGGLRSPLAFKTRLSANLMFHDRPHIVFSGGGTAGHLFPGLALAEMLRRWDWRITFVGTGKTFERRHVIAAGHDYLVLPSRPFSRRVREALLFLTDNVSGFYAARRFLQAEGATLVVGLGGYASGATTRAARSLDIPYVLVEQNAYPGKATRWLADGAELVCAAFADVRGHLAPGCHVRTTGTPVRREFLRHQAATQQRLAGTTTADADRKPRLLVLGGSGGARALNEHVPAAVYKAPRRRWPVGRSFTKPASAITKRPPGDTPSSESPPAWNRSSMIWHNGFLAAIWRLAGLAARPWRNWRSAPCPRSCSPTLTPRATTSARTPICWSAPARPACSISAK